MGRSGSYFNKFQRYGSREAYDFRSYIGAMKETDEERAARKAHERRAHEERHRREDEEHYGSRDERRDSSRKSDDPYKRKSYDDKGKSHISDDSSKRIRLGEKDTSNISEKTTASIPPNTSSGSPALKESDIQTIINRPQYQAGDGPPTLQSRFPNWCLKGVRFDLDLVPIDKPDMLSSLDVVRFNIERMSQWQKLVDALQRVNRANLEAMLTMENDRAEWDKICKQHNVEMTNIADGYAKLEFEVKKLKEDLASSSASHTQKEEVFQKQVRDAHAAQRDVEMKLEAEQHITEKYRTENTDLREKVTSQNVEIELLKSRLAKAETERDEATAGRVAAVAEKEAAEQSHEATKANISS